MFYYFFFKIEIQISFSSFLILIFTPEWMRVLHHRGPFCENNPNKNLIINIKGESESVNFNSHRCASKKKKKNWIFQFFSKEGNHLNSNLYTGFLFSKQIMICVCFSSFAARPLFFFLHDGMFGLFFLICNSFFFFFV